MTKMLRGNGHQPDIEALSAHLDGQLDASRARELDAHIPTCESCEAAQTELRHLRTTLASMPVVEAPRSFRLRVADVEPARKAAVGTGWLNRWAPAVGGLAVALFVVTFGVDRVAQQNDTGGDSAALRSSETTGMIAEDDAASPAIAAGSAPQPDAPGGAITPPDTGTAIAEGEFAQDGDAAGDATATAAGSATNDGVLRTVPGPATEAEVPTPSSAAAETPGSFSSDAPTTGGGGADTTAPAGVAPPDEALAGTAAANSREEQIITAATATPELLALSTEEGDEDGNGNWLLIVQIAAAIVAVAAGGYILARRFMGRGAA